MKDRRNQKRVARRIVIRYGQEKPPMHTSFVMDFSETGVYIQASRIFKPDTKLYLTIIINDNSFDAEGIVAWAKKAPTSLIKISRSGMGIEFTSVDKGLLDICKEKS